MTLTLGEVLSKLTEIANEHGDNVPVYVHDLDTDWSMKMNDEGVRFGKDEFGDGIDGAVMLKASGYYDR